MVKPLNDLRVIEVGTGEGLSMAGRFLAELGAEVLKIESPQGDPQRTLPPRVGKESSYLFEMLNTCKRSVILDLAKEEDVFSLKALMETAEIVIESFPDQPGYMKKIGLGYEAVKVECPGLIYLSLTGFGTDGPYAARPWTDITAQAITGHMYVGGKETDPPIKTGPALGDYALALYGDAGIMSALYNRDRTNCGQYLEVAAADCIVALNATGLVHAYHSDEAGGRIHHQGFVRRGLSHGTCVPYGGFVGSDGLICFVGSVTDKDWAGICASMGRVDLIEHPDYKTNVNRIAHRAECDAIVAEWVSKRPAAESVNILANATPPVPVGLGRTVKEVFKNKQYIDRNLWTTVDGPEGPITVPNSIFRLSETPGTVDRPAPKLGDTTLDGLLGRKPTAIENPEPQDLSAGPLKGMKVLDFTQYVAGSWAPRMFADFGAEVVKVERPSGEVFRFAPPQINGVTGYGGMFNIANCGKRAVALDMKDKRAQKIAMELMGHVDVLMENNAKDVMKRNGVGVEDVTARFPGLIYLSSTGYGQEGPMADRLSYDGTIQAESGLQSLNGFPGGMPCRAGDAVADLLAPAGSVITILAGLHLRQKTGKGQFIDLSQADGAVPLTYSAWPAWFTEGKIMQLYGNRYPFYAPYNGYDAKDRMVVIGVTSDEQWKSLVEAMGEAGAQFRGRYLTTAERLAHVDEIDSVINAWVDDQTAEAVEELCLKHSVPAGKVYTIMENIFDPKFAHRLQTQVFNHKVAGPMRVSGQPVKFSATPSWIKGAGMELIGEYTTHYLTEWLGMDEAEIEQLRTEGAVL